MNARLQPGFDHLVRRPLLGVQCRDAADGRVVAEGLQARLVDAWRPGWQQDLAANRSGVFALHALRGMSSFVDAAPADGVPGPLETSPPEAERWRLEITDTHGRYLPVAFAPILPWGDLVGVGDGAPPASPPQALPHVPLYSAPARVLPPARQALRVELRQADDSTQPAAWTRLELWLDGDRLAEGFAGPDGQALLVFPLPRPREVPLGASPADSADRLSWAVELRAFRSAATAADPLPRLDALLAQPPATLLDPGSPPTPPAPLWLRAGEPLVARGAATSYLIVAD